MDMLLVRVQFWEERAREASHLRGASIVETSLNRDYNMHNKSSIGQKEAKHQIELHNNTNKLEQNRQT